MSIAEKLQTIAENEQKVYEAGKDDEREAFWEQFQSGGTRTSYTFGFYGRGWNDDVYNPIYPFKVTASNQMYQGSYITDTKVDVDLTAGTGTMCGTTFVNASKLKNIRRIIVDEDTPLHQQFTGCSALEYILVAGTIGLDMNMKDCPLTVASAIEVLDSLKNYAGTEYADTYTVTFSEDVWSRLDAWFVAELEYGCPWSSSEHYLLDKGWIKK